MLIEFRVKNFRSFREEQIFSFVASKDKTLLDSNAIATGITAVPHLLTSAAIYGANASGKSNLIKALQYMRGVVAESASAMQPHQSFNVQPFRLDNDSANRPTEFEITFLIGGVRYQYGFSLTTQRVVSEYLLVYKSSKPQRWFDRYYDTETEEEVYEFSPNFKGPKSTWQGATRANSLFLSMAVQLNCEQLNPIFHWLVNDLVIFNETSPLSQHFTIQKLQQEDGKRAICEFLTAADISISDIDIVTRKVQGQNVHVDLATGKTEVREEEVEERQLLFHHVTEKGEAVFGLNDESSGTRNLLFLAGPVLDMLNRGVTLIIDELDTSLHPLLVRRLVELFHHPNFNKRGAQLLFTTHDTSLLNVTGLLRRDQIWFVEKDREQASALYGLSEFSPRKNEALERGYLSGRYGGLPFLNEWE